MMSQSETEAEIIRLSATCDALENAIMMVTQALQFWCNDRAFGRRAPQPDDEGRADK